MSAIRCKGNATTELLLASLLRRAGLSGWRRHQPVFGKPDFVWQQHRTAVFVDGCFWHGCPRCYRPPRANVQYWREKIARNRKRDRKVIRELRENGWQVVRIWECQIAAQGSLDRIARALRIL